MDDTPEQGPAVHVNAERLEAAEQVRRYVEQEGLTLGLSAAQARQRADLFVAGLLADVEPAPAVLVDEDQADDGVDGD